MNLVSKEECTGCGACAKSCPKQAIQFRDDLEGFPTPFIAADLCVDCGICQDVCPAVNMPETNRVRTAYAAQLLDREALMESTSGGIFTALARAIFQREGLVYGCVWDHKYNAVFGRAEKEKDIIPMRGSKYVWSWAGDVFQEIKDFLKAGRIVLFTGMPCQVAGLRSFLRKDYANLYCVSFFCGGAPSPLAFREYLKTITKDVSFEELDFKFRDKKKFGVGVNISYQGKGEREYQSFVRNSYFFAYHKKVMHRRPCYHCRYRYKDRIDDLTFGDFWGVSQYHEEFDIRAGVSALLVNSDKGEELFEQIRDQLQVSPTKAAYIAEANNLTLGNNQVNFKLFRFRNAFFKTLKKKGWSSAEKRYLFGMARLRTWAGTKVPKKYKTVILKVIDMGKRRK